jgi:hypothetical protein
MGTEIDRQAERRMGRKRLVNRLTNRQKYRHGGKYYKAFLSLIYRILQTDRVFASDQLLQPIITNALALYEN